MGTDFHAEMDSLKTTGAVYTPGSDEEIICRAENGVSGELFIALFYRGDFSKQKGNDGGDLALCNILRPHCGWDANKVDRIFRMSQLYRNRDKWDCPGYRIRTLKKCLGRDY